MVTCPAWFLFGWLVFILFFVFVNLAQTSAIWEEKPHLRTAPVRLPAGKSVRHFDDWCRRTQCTIGSIPPGLVVLCSLRKQTKPAMGSKLVSSIYPWALLQFLRSGSCLGFLPSVMEWDQSIVSWYNPLAAFGRGVQHSSGEHTKTCVLVRGGVRWLLWVPQPFLHCPQQQCFPWSVESSECRA